MRVAHSRRISAHQSAELELVCFWSGKSFAFLRFMARIRKLSSELPYHVTARCINRDWFRLPQSIVWEIFNNRLYTMAHAYNVKIHAFVLMDNHFHLIISTPDNNLPQAMQYLMTFTSREITFLSNRVNQTYGGPYFSCLLDCNHHYLNAYKYVYRNPVEAGLANQVELYPYSTLSGLLGLTKIEIPLIEDLLLFENTMKHLSWLNTSYPEGALDEISKALKKSKFKFVRDRITRNVSVLETQLF